MIRWCKVRFYRSGVGAGEPVEQAIERPKQPRFFMLGLEQQCTQGRSERQCDDRTAFTEIATVYGELLVELASDAAKEADRDKDYANANDGLPRWRPRMASIAAAMGGNYSFGH